MLNRQGFLNWVNEHKEEKLIFFFPFSTQFSKARKTHCMKFLQFTYSLDRYFYILGKYLKMPYF